MCIFDWLKPQPVEKTVLTYAEAWRDIAKLANTGREDDWYHCADIENVMEWCYACRSECPPYESNSNLAQGFDCDDFAKCFAAYCRRKNLTNAVWEAWGESPNGYHAWNIIRCPDGTYEVEPQTGETWVLGSKPSYKARVLK